MRQQGPGSVLRPSVAQRPARRHGVLLAFALLVAWVVLPHERAHALGGEEVWVLTMAPGDDLFSRFGHNALLVRDRATGKDIAYNFGTFDGNDPQLLSKYLARKLDYYLSRANLAIMIFAYQGRTVTAQHLALPAAGVDRLVAHLRWMSKPENAGYRYDHIRDNCSTRIRDLIDEATGGALRERFAQAKSGSSIRRELDRILGLVPFERWGVSYILGAAIDEPSTRWENQFLPRNLRDDLSEVTITHPDGVVRPLVDAERKLITGSEEPTTMTRWPLVLLSALFGLPFLLSVLLGAAGTFSRVVMGLTLALWGLLAGIGGALLVFLWVVGFSAGMANGNLLFTSPLHIAFFPLGLLFVFGKLSPRGLRLLRGLLWTVLAVAGGDLLAHLGGFVHQSHLGLGGISALLPALALLALRERTSPLAESARETRRALRPVGQPPVASGATAAVTLAALAAAATQGASVSPATGEPAARSAPPSREVPELAADQLELEAALAVAAVTLSATAAVVLPAMLAPSEAQVAHLAPEAAPEARPEARPEAAPAIAEPPALSVPAAAAEVSAPGEVAQPTAGEASTAPAMAHSHLPPPLPVEAVSAQTASAAPPSPPPLPDEGAPADLHAAVPAHRPPPLPIEAVEAALSQPHTPPPLPAAALADVAASGPGQPARPSSATLDTSALTAGASLELDSLSADELFGSEALDLDAEVTKFATVPSTPAPMPKDAPVEAPDGVFDNLPVPRGEVRTRDPSPSRETSPKPSVR